CYIPFEWEKDFQPEYLSHIRFFCLVMSERYIENHFQDIKGYASVIENRMEDDCTIEALRQDNAWFLEQCLLHKAEYLLIDEQYAVDIEL
ncbi:MAG TPA: adenylate kinase, partial [Lachnospiraceae bacterium]|nr:adenylate kinase [Lachnospiraceae bacterium]